jgi:Uma2 family endonuclease
VSAYHSIVAQPAKKRATYEDVLAAPPNVVAEILNGVLYTHPRPASPAALAGSALGSEIFGPFHRGKNGPGGWVILDEPELHLGDDIVVPDIAGWRRERMPEMPHAAFFDLPPDWICEVLSPSTQALDRAEKMPFYAREGVAHAWLVDPIARTIEAYQLEAKRWVVVGAWRDEAVLRLAPFDAIDIELAALWKR